VKNATTSPSFLKEWGLQDVAVNLFGAEVMIPYHSDNFPFFGNFFSNLIMTIHDRPGRLI
jgi:hypothetical protein